jgi:hypothetical protein
MTPKRGPKPLDVLTAAYFAVVGTLIAVHHREVPGWGFYLAGFAAALAAAAVLIKVSDRHRILGLLRDTYPLFLSPVVYGSIGGYVLILRGHYLDAGMNTFERRVYGGHPTEWLSHLVSRPVTELLYVCYFSFYLFFLIPPLVLFLRRRDADIARYTLPLTAALYVCYLGFLAVPLLGPEHSLAGALHPDTLEGYVVVPLQKFLMAHGDPPGACFPSAHVAGAWAGLFAIGRLWGRRAFRWTLIPTVGLTIAVAYTRYHYATDALAGFAVAVVVVAVIDAVRRRAVREVAEPPSGQLVGDGPAM